MEHFIKKAVVGHLQTNNLVVASQHGFVSGKSCESQLLSSIEVWTELIESNNPVDVMYLDFKKAFDAVPHQRLLSKMEAYGLGQQTVDWLKSFLTNRRQRVVVNSETSEWTATTSGIPQGSILGPLCFILFINDLPQCVRSNILLFADDAKLFGPVSNPAQCASLQSDLNSIMTWTQTWQLPLNLQKCSVLHLGYRNPRSRYHLGQNELVQTEHERDLGIIMDEKLKFHDQSSQVIKKANRILAIIKRSFSFIDKKIFRKLYKALVRPIIEYGNVIWGPWYTGDQEKIEKIQRRATKLVKDIKHLPYQDRMKQLNIPSLSFRRKRGDLIVIFKMVHGLMKTDGIIKPGTRRQNTRGHCYKLLKQQAVRRERRCHITVRAVNAWNNLPEDIVTSSNLKTFKTKLDKYLIGEQYVYV